jgi:hypothetical protein
MICSCLAAAVPKSASTGVAGKVYGIGKVCLPALTMNAMAIGAQCRQDGAAIPVNENSGQFH